MPGDLVGGNYPLTYSLRKLLALTGNNVQGNQTPRSNLEWFGPNVLTDTAAALTSGQYTVVAVPIEWGEEYTYVDVFTGATAASTPTHSWAALYNPSGALLGTQSTDGTSAAIAASAKFTFTLGAKYIANSTDSPAEWLYVAVSVTASTVPSLVTVGGTVATACQYAYYTNGPAYLCANMGSAVGGTAPSTLTTTSKQATVPVVVLR